MKIPGSVALITGGGQGLGKAYTVELLKRDGKVSVVDINEKVGNAFVKQCQNYFGEGNVIFIHCDITDSSSFEEAFEKTKAKFGKIDVVCNNAASNLNGWRKSVDLNLSSVIHGTNLGIQHMSAKNGGNGGLIINVGSMAGFYPYTDDAVYTATKFGVVGFSQSFKDKLTDDKIRINCLCPGMTLTPTLEKALEENQELKAMADRDGIASAEDVAKGFLQLVADESRDGEILAALPKGMFYMKTNIEMIPVQPIESQ